MDAILAAIVQASVAGLIGGTVAGVAAVAAIRVELRYLRENIGAAHIRIDRLEDRTWRAPS